MAKFRERSGELAAEAAEGVLDWAEAEPRLDVRYIRVAGCSIETTRRPLLKLMLDRGIEVHLRTLTKHGEPWDDQAIEQLVQELVDMGVHLESDERTWPKAPLDPLADDQRRAVSSSM